METQVFLKSVVGRNIKKMRLLQNLTQEELAPRIPITAKYLSGIETGRREATIHVYRCIAKALQLPMWILFCELSDETLLVLKHFEDCSEIEIRALRRFIDGNKYALRQHRSLDFIT